MMNPLRFLAGLLGLASAAPAQENILRISQADAIRMGLMRDGHSGSRNSKRQERARARARRARAARRDQRRIARERGLSRSHP
jgi:hypothetical protein